MGHTRRHWLWLITALISASGLAPAIGADPNLPWAQCRAGNRDEYVRTLQYLLRARGYKTKADGIFGAETTSAVKRFQRARKLVADGVVGSQTWRALVITVKRGSRGDAVRAAQNALKIWDYKVAVDGSFGFETEKEVRRFQSDNRMKNDGVVGPATWNTLLAEEQGD